MSFETQHSNPEGQEDFSVEEGLIRLALLSQLKARGEKVEIEMQALEAKLLGHVEESVVEAAKQKGIKDEFRDMDPARFARDTGNEQAKDNHGRWENVQGL